MNFGKISDKDFITKNIFLIILFNIKILLIIYYLLLYFTFVLITNNFINLFLSINLIILINIFIMLIK